MLGVPLGVLGLITEDHKVLRSVVSLISINMVDHFAALKRAPQHLLGNYTVFMFPEMLPVAFTFSCIGPGPA